MIGIFNRNAWGLTKLPCCPFPLLKIFGSDFRDLSSQHDLSIAFLYQHHKQTWVGLYPEVPKLKTNTHTHIYIYLSINIYHQ